MSYIHLTREVTNIETIFDGEINNAVIEAIEALIEIKHKITGIKLLRHVYNLNLVHAKLLYEEIERRYNERARQNDARMAC